VMGVVVAVLNLMPAGNTSVKKSGVGFDVDSQS